MSYFCIHMSSTLTSKVSACRNKQKMWFALGRCIHCAIDFFPSLGYPSPCAQTHSHSASAVGNLQANARFPTWSPSLGHGIEFSFVFLPYLALLCFFFSQPFWAFTNNCVTFVFAILCHFERIGLSESSVCLPIWQREALEPVIGTFLWLVTNPPSASADSLRCRRRQGTFTCFTSYLEFCVIKRLIDSLVATFATFSLLRPLIDYCLLFSHSHETVPWAQWRKRWKCTLHLWDKNCR